VGLVEKRLLVGVGVVPGLREGLFVFLKVGALEGLFVGLVVGWIVGFILGLLLSGKVEVIVGLQVVDFWPIEGVKVSELVVEGVRVEDLVGANVTCGDGEVVGVVAGL